MNDSPGQDQAAPEKTDVSRREFLGGTGLLASLLLTYPAAALAELRRQKRKPLAADWQKIPLWQTLAQVQEVLLPAAKDAPGAADLGATNYLYLAIENTQADAEDRDFIFRGVGWLDGLTQERHKKTFLQLTATQQQQTIAVIVKSRAGRNWVSKLLNYTLEALLMDPVYGGNRNAAGWKWLQHQPGFPAPPADKTWHRLLQRRYQA